MLQSFQPNPKDSPTSQATGTIEVVALIIPTTASVVELTNPIISSDQTKEERQYMQVVTALVRRLNLEATGVILGDMVTA